ncbi:uncharacterized protein LOC116115601 [Pistacia vera]|uniref:uncharacterized protein LOC116115601 n=1 Tax=Pistacia vera TaxID=55513 RepID=UPI001263D5FB|nr:uncharacterized protein LOC116115601 [Pistacia vera]
MADTKVKLKLLVDTQAKKVLFAEAGKDFADFLFYLLSLPVGTFVRVIEKKSMAGCLGNLYDSIENLSETYIQPNQNKSSLLNPKSPIYATEIPVLVSDHELNSSKVYMCPHNHLNVAEIPDLVCPQCKEKMTTEVPYVNASSNSEATNTTTVAEGGFVKGVVTYMVMDNLELQPMSTISSITLLNRFNVKDVGSLEEKVVDFGVEEGLKLLKASLECKTVLTTALVSYMARDDLSVTPASKICGIDFLQQNVRDTSALEERVFEFGTDEGRSSSLASLYCF